MTTTLKDKIVITRKDHICYSCHRKFPSGTKMRNWAGIYDGAFNSVYSCHTCDKIMSSYVYDPDEGYPDGFVREMLDKDQTPEQLLIELQNEK